ncbi:helix-turn-helix transcriptional regulator [Clostridium sp.]|uniref:helix-turn-helix domain-containing protein n=1 Tax=Clostridium sp. TaxID=1506 RepID=UPI0028447F8E|nr:helix-turn-helix transcriptional regulator [Clostridium sp.]MDR3598713.1 helix-turn-helix transcriptional regulator [Clostridium sp.]
MNNAFGKNLHQLRTNRGLSLKDVEHELGLSASYIHRLESGNRSNPSIGVLKMLSDFYGVNSSILLETTNKSGVKPCSLPRIDVEFTNDTIVKSLLNQLFNRLLDLNSDLYSPI